MWDKNEWMREPEVVEATGLARATLRLMELRDEFPKRHKMGRSIFWKRAEVEEWLARHGKATRRKRTSPQAKRSAENRRKMLAFLGKPRNEFKPMANRELNSARSTGHE